MADTNWIKLNRKIWDNFIWSFEKPKYALAWIDILLQANYRDKKILFDGKPETIKRGSFITSMVKLSERWEMDRGTVKRLLDLLQNEGMITYSCNNRRTLINVVKYEVFQQLSAGDTTAETAADPTADATADPTADPAQHKNIKEGKEGKEGEEGKEDIGGNPDAERPAPSASIPFEAIKNLFNETCKSFPRCTVMSDARKKAVKARFSSGYTLDTFKTLFEKAEASSFLKGKNDRNWTANFDWLIKDANMAKVLDGNYDDKGVYGNGNGKSGINPGENPRIGRYL